MNSSRKRREISGANFRLGSSSSFSSEHENSLRSRLLRNSCSTSGPRLRCRTFGKSLVSSGFTRESFTLAIRIVNTGREVLVLNSLIFSGMNIAVGQGSAEVDGRTRES
jgi:hypothetical protein